MASNEPTNEPTSDNVNTDTTLTDLVADFRRTTEAAERKARTRIALTVVLLAGVVGYMSWMYAGVSKLDAAAVTAIARQHVQTSLPDAGQQLSQLAMDAAPELLDKGEAAMLTAPSALRDAVEERLLEGTRNGVAAATAELDTHLATAVQQRLDAMAAATGDDQPTLDELMQALRSDYRDNATALTTELYLAYAREITGVEDFLAHLKTSDTLTPRERAQREIIEASVALKQHFVIPAIEPIPISDDNQETGAR